MAIHSELYFRTDKPAPEGDWPPDGSLLIIDEESMIFGPKKELAWHDWFAWHPVLLGPDRKPAWLRWVRRRRVDVGNEMDIDYRWRYQEAGGDETDPEYPRGCFPGGFGSGRVPDVFVTLTREGRPVYEEGVTPPGSHRVAAATSAAAAWYMGDGEADPTRPGARHQSDPPWLGKRTYELRKEKAVTAPPDPEPIGELRVHGLAETQGEGNGWYDVPDAEATLFTVEDDVEDFGNQTFPTRAEAQAWIDARRPAAPSPHASGGHTWEDLPPG